MCFHQPVHQFVWIHRFGKGMLLLRFTSALCKFWHLIEGNYHGLKFMGMRYYFSLSP